MSRFTKVRTIEPNFRQVVVVFTVHEDLDDNNLHDLICRAVHEETNHPMSGNIADVSLVGPIHIADVE